MTSASQKTLRVGIVGLGFGASVHLPVFQAEPGVDVVGIAGRSASKAQDVAKSRGVAHGCGSVDELLSLQLDAISLAVPPNQVAPAVRKALGRGIAVLCEKPLGMNSEEAAELASLAQGQTTAVDYIFAELTTFSRLKHIIETGALGSVRHVDVLWLTESWANKSRTWLWKTDASLGGGAISLFGAHLFYLVEWLFGPAINVRARVAPPVSKSFAPPGELPAEDLVHCWTEHEGGVLLTAVFGNANPDLAIHRWIVAFERGSIVLENQGNDYVSGFKLRVFGSPGLVEELHEPHTDVDGRVVAFRRLARRFISAVHARERMLPDFAAGARAQGLDAAVRKSAANRSELQFLD